MADPYGNVRQRRKEKTNRIGIADETRVKPGGAKTETRFNPPPNRRLRPINNTHVVNVGSHLNQFVRGGIRACDESEGGFGKASPDGSDGRQKENHVSQPAIAEDQNFTGGIGIKTGRAPLKESSMKPDPSDFKKRTREIK